VNHTTLSGCLIAGKLNRARIIGAEISARVIEGRAAAPRAIVASRRIWMARICTREPCSLRERERGGRKGRGLVHQSRHLDASVIHSSAFARPPAEAPATERDRSSA